jgi:peroxiredoxin Q/BCP
MNENDESEKATKIRSPLTTIGKIVNLCILALALGAILAALFLIAARPAKPQNQKVKAEETTTMSQKTEAKGPAKLNQAAPDFELRSEAGKTVRLGDFKGKQAVVVYFYPKDDTPGCTAESCAFRDAYEDFKDEGAEVIGISSDSVDSHKSFAEKHNLPFILLSDQGGKVRSQWGVPTTLGLLPGRVSYVIDKKGIVRNIFNSQLEATKHVAEAKKVLVQIKSE